MHLFHMFKRLLMHEDNCSVRRISTSMFFRPNTSFLGRALSIAYVEQGSLDLVDRMIVKCYFSYRVFLL